MDNEHQGASHKGQQSMNAYKFDPGAYIAITRHLCFAEDGALRRLIDLYHITDAPLQGDVSDLCRLLCVDKLDEGEEECAVGVVLEEFFEETEHGWSPNRLLARVWK